MGGQLVEHVAHQDQGAVWVQLTPLGIAEVGSRLDLADGVGDELVAGEPPEVALLFLGIAMVLAVLGAWFAVLVTDRYPPFSLA